MTSYVKAVQAGHRPFNDPWFDTIDKSGGNGTAGGSTIVYVTGSPSNILYESLGGQAGGGGPSGFGYGGGPFTTYPISTSGVGNKILVSWGGNYAVSGYSSWQGYSGGAAGSSGSYGYGGGGGGGGGFGGAGGRGGSGATTTLGVGRIGGTGNNGGNGNTNTSAGGGGGGGSYTSGSSAPGGNGDSGFLVLAYWI